MCSVRDVLSPRVPELSALELLLTVAREGSLGAAALVHGVSQPAVSSRIRTIERLVGFAVVERTARGSALTARGALLAEWAQTVVHAATVLDAGIAALRTDARARLRLAASLTVAEYLLPVWLARWRAEHPDVEISLAGVNSAEAARLVLAGEADLGFTEGPTAPARLSSRVIGRDRLVVVAAPDHPWVRRRRPVGVAELARTPLVAREPASGTRIAFEAALRSATQDVQLSPAPPVLELSTTSAVRGAAAAGAAPAVISDLAARDDIAAGRLVEIAVPGLDLGRELRAVWPRGGRPTGLVRDLLGLIGRAAPGA